MGRQRKRITRREFLRDAALTTSGIVLAGMVPPAWAQAPGPSKLGAQLIGKLEGPELVRDPLK